MLFKYNLKKLRFVIIINNTFIYYIVKIIKLYVNVNIILKYLPFYFLNFNFIKKSFYNLKM